MNQDKAKYILDVCVKFAIKTNGNKKFNFDTLEQHIEFKEDRMVISYGDQFFKVKELYYADFKSIEVFS